MIEEIAADFYRIEIPLPKIFLKSVNAYVIRDRERNLIIDTGMYDDKCMQAMQAGLKQLGIDLKKTDFFITHSHVDHIGLVPRLIHAGSIIYINKLEADFIQKIESGVFFFEIRDLLRISGFPEKVPAKILPPNIDIKRDFTLKGRSRFQFLEDGNTIARGRYRFICVNTPGHSKGHMCLYEPDKKILIAGDHLLKDITPGIQGRIDNENPLKEYLSSLDKVYALDIDIVLPGHRALFRNCKKRIKEIKEHHRQRSCEIISILQEGERSIYETASRMTWNMDCDSWASFPVLQSFFATAEAFAHLGYLEKNGEVERRMEGETAIYRLSATLTVANENQ